MPAYVVLIREGEIVDPEAMEKYRTQGTKGPPPADMKVLAVYGEQETIEGEPCEGVVLLEFPDRDAARKWYYGDYQNYAKYRIQAAPYRGFIVDGI